jgi:predicted MFS family arabinose efflux permease
VKRFGSAPSRLLLFVMAGGFLIAFGHQSWQAMFNNFAVEELAAGPQAIGWIQSVREVPGLLAFAVALLALLVSELRLMSLSVLMLGIGLALTSQAQGIPGLLAATLVMSVGFHFFNPCGSSVVLMSTPSCDAPRALGALRSISAMGAVAATGAVYLLAGTIGYRPLFAGVGLAITAAGVALLPFGGRRRHLPTRRRITLRRRYALFYALAFLMGSRRHIFTTFAIFLLVSEFGISVQVTAILFLANALINTVAYRLIGGMIGRFGERRVLTVAFLGLLPVFLGYAFATWLPLLFGLFIVDNILFGMNLALTTYLQKIAVSPEELTSNLSLQETINHISAVVVPVIGGTIWAAFGSQAPFLAGLVIALLSLLLARRIRIPEDAPTPPASLPAPTGS